MQRILEMLRELKPEKLFVVADGPKNEAPDELTRVGQVRALFNDLPWACSVTKIYSDVNLGLKKRVESGLDAVFEEVDAAIILEDDCLPSPTFFSFASEMLERYSHEDRIHMVSGNNFAPNSRNLFSYYFSNHSHIWGWATWARAWKSYRSSGFKVHDVPHEALLTMVQRIPGRQKRKSFAKLLQNLERLDSWAVPFASHAYFENKLSIVPKVNLVTNVGFGQDSTHTKFESYVDEIPLADLEFPLTHPTEVAANHREMSRESLRRYQVKFFYPIVHPLDFLRRLKNYFFPALEDALRERFTRF